MDLQLNAAELYKLIVDPRSINQILRDDGGTDEQMEQFWKMIGIPITPEVRQSVSLTIILQNLAAAALGGTHPYSAKITRDAFLAWLQRQRFTDREINKILESMGWIEDDQKNIASILTRLCKSIVRPDVIQG